MSKKRVKKENSVIDLKKGSKVWFILKEKPFPLMRGIIIEVQQDPKTGSYIAKVQATCRSSKPENQKYNGVYTLPTWKLHREDD